MSDQPFAKATGIFTLDRDEYQADPCVEPSLSASIAHLLTSQSPRHAWTAHPRLNPNFERQEAARFDLGTTVHALLLEERDVDDVLEIIDAPDWRTAAAREARDAARAVGRIPLLAHHVDGIRAMLKTTRPQLDAVNAKPGLFVDGKPEQTLIWQEDGITCRALVDWLHNDYTTIDDFKTTSKSADPHRWTSRTLFSNGSDVQAAFYRRGLRAITGEDEEAQMRYAIQETYPPFALSVVSLGPDVLAFAEAKVERAIELWRKCLKSGDWPGYTTEVCFAELPPWEETRFLQQQALEEEAA